MSIQSMSDFVHSCNWLYEERPEFPLPKKKMETTLLGQVYAEASLEESVRPL